MASSPLTSRNYLNADAYARRLLASSSVAPVYASALSYTHSCVIPNTNAYRFSRPVNAICPEVSR
jgi:hypothetical protein